MHHSKDDRQDPPESNNIRRLEKLFSLNSQSYSQCQQRYRGEAQREYYKGDFWIANNRPVHSHIRKVGAVSIINQVSETDLFFRRTRRHIREDPTDLTVLWFLKQGTLSISTNDGERWAEVGELAITRSMLPFLIQCKVDKKGLNEVLHITIPTHQLRTHVSWDAKSALIVSSGKPELGFAQRILSDIFSERGGLRQASALRLIDVALDLVGTAVEAGGPRSRSRPTVGEVRYQEIVNFIQIHLANPSLCASMVAQGCGISRRHLSGILHERDTGLQHLIWGARLERARIWLSTSQPGEISVAEIGYSLGFKSPAHFSRSFKRRFGYNPSDVRADEALQPIAS